MARRANNVTVTKRRAFNSNLVKQSLVANLQSMADDLAERSLEQGRKKIDRSATNRQWTGYPWRYDPRADPSVRSATGRNDTGRMRRQFRTEVTVTTRKTMTIRIRIGWLDSNQPRYFQQQEEGFVWRSDDYTNRDERGRFAPGFVVHIQVPGMHVIPYVGDYVRRAAPQLIRQAVGRTKIK